MSKSEYITYPRMAGHSVKSDMAVLVGMVARTICLNAKKNANTITLAEPTF
jgi:hypothetical protein